MKWFDHAITLYTICISLSSHAGGVAVADAGAMCIAIGDCAALSVRLASVA